MGLNIIARKYSNYFSGPAAPTTFATACRAFESVTAF
jgi:hypothetical protein